MKPAIKKAFHILKYLVISLVLLFAFVVGIVNLPVVHKTITNKANQILAESGYPVHIGKFTLLINGKIGISEVSIIVPPSDTIIYAGKASININPLPLLRNKIDIVSVSLSDVWVNIRADEKTGSLNIISVFTKDIPVTEKQEEAKDEKTGTPWEISLNHATLKNIRFSYFDQQGGISVVQNLKKAQFSFSTFSLLNQTILADRITLEEPSGMVGIWSSEIQKEDEAMESANWKFALNQLNVSNLKFQLDQPESGTHLEVRLQEGHLSLKNLDLAKQRIETGEIELKQPEIDYVTSGKTSETPRQEETPVKIAFPEIPWEIISEKISVTDGSLNLKNEDGKTAPELEKWLPVSNLNFVLNTVSLAPGKSAINLEKLNAKIGNSINLISGSLSFEADSTQNVRLQTNLAVAEKSERNKWFGNNHEITFDATIFGSLNSVLQISSVELKSSTSLQFSLDGNISGISDYNQAVCNIDYKTSIVSREQVSGLLSALGITAPLPAFSPFTVKGNISNTILHPFMTLDLVSAAGNVSLAGNYNTKTNESALKGDFRNVKLAQLFGESAPQNISGKIDIREKINTTGFPAGTAEIHVDSVFYNNKNIRDISLKINSERNNAEYSLTAADTALFCDLNGTLKSQKSGYSGQLNGSFDVNPFALNFLENPLKIKGEIDGSFGYSKSKTDVNIKLEKLTVQNENKTVNLENMKLEMASGDSLLYANLRSAVLNVDFSSLATPDELQKAYLSANFETAFNTDSTNFINLTGIGNLNKFRLDAKIHYHPFFLLFYPDTTLNFNDINILIEKESVNSIIEARINTDKLKFDPVSCFQPTVTASIESDMLKMTVQTDSVNVSGIRFGTSSATLNILPSLIDGRVNIIDSKGEVLYKVEAQAEKKDNNIKLKSSPEWIINGRKWTITPSEFLSWSPETKKMMADVNIFSDKMQVKFNNRQNDNYELILKDLAIGSLVPSGFEELIPGGVLNARVNYAVSETNDLNFDLKFSNISWQNLVIGEITAKGSLISDSTGIINSEINLTIDDSSKASIVMGSKNLSHGEKMRGRFNDLPILLIEPFISDYATRMRGSASGDFTIREEKEKFILDGDISMNKVSMKIIPLNTTLSIPGNKLEIKNSRLIFNSFTVLDSLKKSLILNGDINFSDVNNMTVGLNVKTDNVLLMNTTEKESPAFFGSVVVNSAININGLLLSPEIRGNIKLEKGTNITYQLVQDLTVKGNQTDVIFAGIDSSLQVIFPVKTEEKNVTQMPNIQTSITIDPNSVFNVKIADIYNVDISIAGSGNLNYSMLPNNTMSLNGVYEIRNGECLLKITGWPRKDFTITPGSSFRWNGTIENPELNLEATTKVRGSYLNPIDNKNRTVDFVVAMKLENTLSNLGIVFNIQSSDQYITSMINSLSEDDLMRQAVNLLLFETIDIPGIQSSGNYMTSQISSFWESQLNALTKTSFKKTDLSFGIDTYDQNSASGKQEKTSFTYQMERKFINDRATVKLSGKLNDYEENGYQTNSIFENFIFEYALDSVGSKFIKLYQNKDYEDMLEGEMIKYGIGFLYRKSYNDLNEIWQRKKKKANQPDNTKQ